MPYLEGDCTTEPVRDIDTAIDEVVGNILFYTNYVTLVATTRYEAI